MLLTRARAEAERSARSLQERGFDALVAPLTTIRPIGSPYPQGPVSAIVVTSAHAVPALATLRGELAAHPVFAVGARTTSALVAAGFEGVETASGTGADLAALIARRATPGATLLHVAGRDRKSEPEASLTAEGFQVLPWIVYAAEAEPALPTPLAEALSAGTLEAALHYSRRSLAILLDLAAAAALEPALLALRHVCLSADVATILSERGAARIAVAERPDETDLIAALRGRHERPVGAGSPAPHSR